MIFHFVQGTWVCPTMACEHWAALADDHCDYQGSNHLIAPLFLPACIAKGAGCSGVQCADQVQLMILPNVEISCSGLTKLKVLQIFFCVVGRSHCSSFHASSKVYKRRRTQDPAFCTFFLFPQCRRLVKSFQTFCIFIFCQAFCKKCPMSKARVRGTGGLAAWQWAGRKARAGGPCGRYPFPVLWVPISPRGEPGEFFRHIPAFMTRAILRMPTRQEIHHGDYCWVWHKGKEKYQKCIGVVCLMLG